MRPFRWYVIAAVMLFLSVVLGRSPLRYLLFSLAIAAFLLGLRAADKYDLSELRRIVEEDESGEQDTVYCPFCGEGYDSDLPVCPNCRR